MNANTNGGMNEGTNGDTCRNPYIDRSKIKYPHTTIPRDGGLNFSGGLVNILTSAGSPTKVPLYDIS